MIENNKFLADVNEIALCLKMVQNDWDRVSNPQYLKEVYEHRARDLDYEDVQFQIARAEAMAYNAYGWAALNGFQTPVIVSHWTAHPGGITGAVGYEVDSKKNPTDVLCQMWDREFLGLSAKSTREQGEISFGTGSFKTIDSSIDTSLNVLAEEQTERAITIYDLPTKQKDRKRAIRNDPVNGPKIKEMGSDVLGRARDAYINALRRMPQQTVKEHIKDFWFRATKMDPVYIKVTGYGVGYPYKTSVEFPETNFKIDKLDSGFISFEELGDNTIGVRASDQKIFIVRAKWESGILSSNPRFIAYNWS